MSVKSQTAITSYTLDKIKFKLNNPSGCCSIEKQDSPEVRTATVLGIKHVQRKRLCASRFNYILSWAVAHSWGDAGQMHHSCLRTTEWESFQSFSFFSPPKPTPVWVQQEPTAFNQESMLPWVQPSSITGDSLNCSLWHCCWEHVKFITPLNTPPLFLSYPPTPNSCSFINIGYNTNLCWTVYLVS